MMMVVVVMVKKAGEASKVGDGPLGKVDDVALEGAGGPLIELLHHAGWNELVLLPREQQDGDGELADDVLAAPLVTGEELERTEPAQYLGASRNER
jgi:hypothetical protein